MTKSLAKLQPTERVCVSCGKTFIHYGNAQAKYCSEKCRQKYNTDYKRNRRHSNDEYRIRTNRQAVRTCNKLNAESRWELALNRADIFLALAHMPHKRELIAKYLLDNYSPKRKNAKKPKNYCRAELKAGEYLAPIIKNTIDKE